MENQTKLAGLVVAVASALAGSGCRDGYSAMRAAEKAGWKNVQVEDSEYFFNFTCEDGEMAYRIRGENPRGEPSEATVCCGYTTALKGCTIRYE